MLKQGSSPPLCKKCKERKTNKNKWFSTWTTTFGAREIFTLVWENCHKWWPFFDEYAVVVDIGFKTQVSLNASINLHEKKKKTLNFLQLLVSSKRIYAESPTHGNYLWHCSMLVRLRHVICLLAGTRLIVAKKFILILLSKYNLYVF